MGLMFVNALHLEVQVFRLVGISPMRNTPLP